eukprot:TRINITY_DN1080_c0_g1_i2.p1 TRINITY_DN1080_c0_g1~~TRINITY_DN1080_c0_g1_i2.p1  ORF type:complete len:466 (-),score=129.46 TRINITY_DN1080_c0_g1_i2:48-1445(-)
MQQQQQVPPLAQQQAQLESLLSGAAGLKGLARYRDMSGVRAQAMDLLKANYAFQIVHGTMPGSQATQVVKLAGTVPIQWRCARYNIPVSIYLPEMFPARPPTVFLSPTPDMVISPQHKHVDAQGQVYLPYLNLWTNSPHNLIGLCQTMSETFSAEPPLRSTKSAQAPVAASSMQVRNTAPQHYEQPPSYAVATGGAGSAGGASGSTYAGYYAQNSPYVYATANTGAASPVAAYYNASAQQNYNVAGPQNQLPYNSYSPSAAAAAPRQAYPPGSYGYATGPYPQQPYGAVTGQQYAEDPAVAQRRRNLQQLQEKISQQLSTHYAAAQADADSLRDDSRRILEQATAAAARRDALNARIASLRAEFERADAEAASLRAWIDDRSAAAAAAVSGDIDAASEPEATPRRQMLNAVAADAAIEDVLYQLSKRVTPETLEEHLKLIRTLAREQFFHRALAIKIAKVLTART